MTKIKIKISYNTLKTVSDLYIAVMDVHAVSPQEYHFKKDYKAVKSVLDELIQKLTIKLLKKHKDCKPFTLIFSYYQAFYLSLFLFANTSFYRGIYEQNTVRLLATELDQQL